MGAELGGAAGAALNLGQIPGATARITARRRVAINRRIPYSLYRVKKVVHDIVQLVSGCAKAEIGTKAAAAQKREHVPGDSIL